MLLILSLASTVTIASGSTQSPWLKKPVLGYLLWTSDSKIEKDVSNFKATLQLSDDEFNNIKQIAKDEMDILNKMHQDSNKETDDQKRLHAKQFNIDVTEVLKNTDRELEKVLGVRKSTFDKWISDWWQGEMDYRKSKDKENNNGMQLLADMSPINVYATQYAAYTNFEVALPDKKIKYANLGWPGGYPNPPYTIDIYYQVMGNGHWVYNVPVKEVGPWNEDDNYWDSASGSNPRRLFTDLPLGFNESYYAYVYNYNNGKDQFGRTVTNSAGVDLAPAIAQQLGLGNNNGWVNIYVSSLP